MQAIMEIIFDLIYLIMVFYMGFQILHISKSKVSFYLYGIMALVLGIGDSFHLIPRIIALCTSGLDNYAMWLGIGKFITSITMTIFYVILYYFWRYRYGLHYWIVDISIWLLSCVRIILCLFPQNNWLSNQSPLSWNIYRNIPFLLLGLIIIALFYAQVIAKKDNVFRYLWLAILFSFIFYIPVVLWANIFPKVALLMIPKTCAYLWVIWRGYSYVKKGEKR